MPRTSTQSEATTPGEALVDSHPTDEQYDVEQVLRKRASPGGTQYLVKWTGCETPSWEPESNLADASDALDEYEKRVRDPAPASRPITATAAVIPAAAAVVPNTRVMRSAARAAPADSDDDSADGLSGSTPAVMSVLRTLTHCSCL